MISEVEKPLLSDYEVTYTEVVGDSKESLPEQEKNDLRPTCSSCRGAPRKQANWAGKLQKLEKIAQKIAVPASRKAVSLGCESFVPAAVEDECQKAARLVTNFSYASISKSPESVSTSNADNQEVNEGSKPEGATSQPHIISIPPRVIAEAVGLIVFTTGRVGLGHMSMSTGSGLLLVRQDDGEWASPVPIQSYSLGGGPLAFGAEVTDRIYVLNNRSALELFKNARFELGPEAVLAAGPYGGGGGVTFSGMSSVPNEGAAQPGEPHNANTSTCSNCGCHQGAMSSLRRSLAQPVYCYMRSRGLYAGLQAEGTVFVQHIEQEVPRSAAAPLFDAIKKAEGSSA